MRFQIRNFLLVCTIFFGGFESDLLAQSSQEACAKVFTLTYQNKKRLAHFVSRLQIRESDLTPDLVSSLTKFWVKRDQIRSEEIAKAMAERGISREDANIAFEIETFEISESLYFESITASGRIMAENLRLQRARENLEQSGLESADRAPAAEYRVELSKRVENARDKAYREYIEYFNEFIEDLRSNGPYDDVITRRTNHQATTGRYGLNRPGYTHYHSHLKRGQPTMVVGFWVNDSNPRDIIIDFWGTHEGVPWRDK
ncbi:MAG: hypothetical protein ACO3LE_08755 [Bdellovibrionota bacterium]